MAGPDANPYDSIDENPNIQDNSGYGNTVPPSPGPGAREAAEPAYALQPVPGDHPGTLPTPIRQGFQRLNPHLSAILFGLAGSAFAPGPKGTMHFIKGAIGGLVACWVVGRKMPGTPCTLAGAAGGYAASRWAKRGRR